MKKYLFKVSFIMRAFILGKDYEQKGVKHILIEAENYDTASDIVYESMKKAYCCFQVEDVPCERQKARRLYDALDKFSRDANEVSAAWLELDESIKTEEELSDTLTKYYPKTAISASFDDFAHDVSEWNRKVQEKIIKN